MIEQGRDMPNNWAIILLRWSDDENEPFTRHYAEQLFTTDGAGTGNVVDFYRAMSHGRIDPLDSEVFGWFLLTHSRAEFVAAGRPHDLIIQWGEEAASANDTRISTFGYKVFVFSTTEVYFGRGGVAVIGHNGADPFFNSVDLSGVCHEMGHAFGLQHSRRDPGGVAYGDPWDIMSVYTNARLANPDTVPATMSRPYYTFGPGLNAVNMAIMGWLDETRVYSPGDTPVAKVVLRPLHRHDLPGFLAVRLKSTIYVEFRINDRWDAAFFTPIVLVHRRGVDPDNGIDCSYLLEGRSAAGSKTYMLGSGGSWEYGSASDARREHIKVLVRRADSATQEAELEIRYRPPLELTYRPPRDRSDESQGVLIGGVEVDGGGYYWIPGKDPTPVPPGSPLIEIMGKLAAVQQVQDSGGTPREASLTSDRLLIEARDALDRLIAARREPCVPGRVYSARAGT